MNNIDTKAFKKAFQNIGKQVNEEAAKAVKSAVTERASVALSFDETESIPFFQGNTGQITVSNSTGLPIEELIAIEADSILDSLGSRITVALKEAFK